MSSNDQMIFMIHPGIAGCEVYTDLAAKVFHSYHVIGIDNYNINNPNHNIDSLYKLSELYLNEIMDSYNLLEQKEIILLGWSLGGQISLEIAVQLESKGFRNIKVILLDTLLPDETINKNHSEIDQEFLKKGLYDHFKKQGYDENYIKNVLNASESENKIVSQSLSKILEYTDIDLYKALLEDKRFFEKNNLYNYILLLKDNNIQAVSKSIINIIELECHHGNIPEYLVQNSNICYL